MIRLPSASIRPFFLPKPRVPQSFLFSRALRLISSTTCAAQPACFVPFRHVLNCRPSPIGQSRRQFKLLRIHEVANLRWFNTAKPNPKSSTRIVDQAKSGLEVVGNVAILLVGLVIICGVPYLLFRDLLGNEGHIKWFSDALQRVRHDPNVIKFLGTPIKGYGDSSHSRMARNRQIGYTITHDRRGQEHMLIRFFVEGPLNTGTVKMDLVRNPQYPDTWQYNYLLVEVPGHGLPSWRLVLDTTQPAPPPAWQETALDMYQTASKSVIQGKDLVVGSTLHGYDIVKEWINSRWNK